MTIAARTPWWAWTWPALAFLAFMLPLPFSIEQGISLPLRRLATVVGTYVLQTIGCPAFAEGNVIYIEDARLGVAGPCSGLGMLLTLSALATVFALLVNRPLLDRLILVASAVPIAVAANVGRITATGIAYYAGGQHSPAAQAILHDVAGNEHRVDRPVPRPRLRERLSERRCRLYAAQRLGFAAVQVRIGKLYETQLAHVRYDIRAPRAVRVVVKA